VLSEAAAGALWWAEGGALRCRTDHSVHVLPATAALWLPAGVAHEVQALGGATLRSVRVALSWPAQARPSSRVFHAGPLLQALVTLLDGAGDAVPATRRQRLACALLREELEEAPPLALGIALPRTPALRAACESALRAGARDCSLHAMAQAVGTSVRTLARNFRQELQLPFGDWRAQVRLARAVELWAQGSTLGASAAAVGYASPSAFSAMVRKRVGVAPRQLLGSALR
jgi:AraC-like DNA-binding protein